MLSASSVLREMALNALVFFACLHIFLIGAVGSIWVFPFALILSTFIFYRCMKRLATFSKMERLLIISASLVTLCACIYLFPGALMRGPQKYVAQVVFQVVDKQKYTKTLSNTSPRPSVKVFRAGGGYSNPTIIIYDVREEIKLKPELRSAQWWRGVTDAGEFKACHYYALPLGDHFFEINFSC